MPLYVADSHGLNEAICCVLYARSAVDWLVSITALRTIILLLYPKRWLPFMYMYIIYSTIQMHDASSRTRVRV